MKLNFLHLAWVLLSLLFSITAPLFGMEANSKFLKELERCDVSYFIKKWNDAKEEQKQLFVNQQGKVFKLLFSQLESPKDYQPEKFALLAKLIRTGPGCTPYLIKLLDFINAQDMEKKQKYFNILVEYLPDFSAEPISFTFTDELDKNKTYLAYYDGTLLCLVKSELIKLQLVAHKSKDPVSIVDSILKTLKIITALKIEIVGVDISTEKDKLSLTISIAKPHGVIKMTGNEITIEIDRTYKVI
ncbi:MAG: hypothetical protein LBM70_08760 [Victivallales bacterium]|jgi:hypothetical protein|nr:hypothetical protein [Victivallales bacterium]